MDNYLKETCFLDFNHPRISEFVKDIDLTLSAKDIAVQLYFLVRDSFMYDPYHLDITKEGLNSSNVVSKKRAWCVEKATLLASCARKFNIPSRLGYAIVTNHIGVERLTEYLKRKEIVFHGYVELFIDNKWVKCTPSFDKNICRLANVTPLNWDGENDSMFQEFDKGKKFMEYLHFYGEFDDVPIELMNSEMKKHYPHLFNESFNSKSFSFKHL
jgi:transglutaminase-like putative cysteine protease